MENTKKVYVVIHGHVGRLLDISDLQIVESKKRAIYLCETLEANEYCFLDMEVNATTSDTEIKKMALKLIW